MRILRAARAIVLFSLLFLGAGLCEASWALLVHAQEEPDAATAPEQAPEGSSEQEYVIPPEQEALLADMVGRGATLDGCKMGSGEIDRKVVNVTYVCPSGEVAIQLVHPDVAPSGATRTDQFAISVQSGAPPEGMLSALESRIRSKETDFEWKLVGGAPESGGLFSGGDMGGGGSISWVRLGVAALLAIGVVWWILRRLAAGRKAQ